MIVIDASVASKFFLSEKDSEKAQILLDNHLLGTEQILIPQFLFLEVTNTLTSKTSFLIQDVTASLATLYESEFKIWDLTQVDLQEASKLAKRCKTSVYDMIYSVIAKNNKTNLITADEKFIKQTGFKWVKLLKDS